MKQNVNNRARRTASIVFYSILGVGALVFTLFRTVGYDMPYYANPDYNAPLLTDLLTGFMATLTVACAAVSLWSMARGVSNMSREDHIVNNIHLMRLRLCTAAATALLLIATFALGGGEVYANGTPYSDSFWLRCADMLVNTSMVMVTAAIAAVMFGLSRNIRTRKDKLC